MEQCWELGLGKAVMSQGFPRDSGLRLQQELWGGARGYDRSYGVEPENMVSDPEKMTGVMGWSQRSGVYGVKVRGYGVRARGYDRNYGVEPEDMVSESMTGTMGG